MVNYRRRGRFVIAGYAWYKFGQSVKDGSIIGATSWGIVAVEASIAVIVPDPVAHTIGWIGTKVLGKLWTGVLNVYRWIANLSIAMVRLVPYIVPITVALFGRQLLAESGFYEEHSPDKQMAIVTKDVNRMALWLAEANVYLFSLSVKGPNQNIA